jgi:hypothetical protein
VLISVWIEASQPLTGTAAIEGGEPRHFDGWLELLRVVSELVDAASRGGGDAGTVKSGDDSADRSADAVHSESPGREQPEA